MTGQRKECEPPQHCKGYECWWKNQRELRDHSEHLQRQWWRMMCDHADGTTHETVILQDFNASYIWCPGCRQRKCDCGNCGGLGPKPLGCATDQTTLSDDFCAALKTAQALGVDGLALAAMVDNYYGHEPDDEDRDY